MKLPFILHLSSFIFSAMADTVPWPSTSAPAAPVLVTPIYTATTSAAPPSTVAPIATATPAPPSTVAPIATATPAPPAAVTPVGTTVSQVALSSAEAALTAKVASLANPVTLDTNDPITDGFEANVGIVAKAPDGSMWTKQGSADTAWERILISTNGEFSANVELATVATDQVPAAGVLGLYGGLPTVGDGSTVRGKLIQTAWPVQWIGFDPVAMVTSPVTYTFAASGDANPTLASFAGLKAGVMYRLSGIISISDGDADGSFAGVITASFSAAGYYINNLTRTMATSGVGDNILRQESGGGGTFSALGTSITICSTGATTNSPVFTVDVRLVPKSDCTLNIVLTKSGPYPRTYSIGNSNISLTAIAL